MAQFVGGREGVDRTLFVIAAGMVILAFSNPLWQSLHALGWIILAVTMVREKKWLVPGPRRWALPWMAFAAWTVLAASLGPNPADGLHDTKKLLNLLAVFFLGAILRSAADARRILAAACVVMAAEAVVGLVQFANVTDHIAFRAHGSLSHHMTYSGMLLITISMALAMLRARLGAATFAWWVYVILGTAALLATLARSAWIGLAVAIAVVLAFKRPRWLLALPVVLAVLFLAVPQIRERTWSIFDVEHDYSNIRRLSMYRAGLRMIADNPILGLGGRRAVKGGFAAYEPDPPLPPTGPPGGPPPDPYERPGHLHNNLLQIAAASGIPALLAWLAALGVFFREAWRLMPRRNSAMDDAALLRRDVLVGSLAAACAFLTMGMLEFNFGDSEVSVLAFFVLCLPFVIGREDETQGESH